MKSIGLQIKVNRNTITVLDLLHDFLWGKYRRQLGAKERKMILKIYRRLEKQEVKIERAIYKMEREIHNLEEYVQMCNAETSNTFFSKPSV